MGYICICSEQIGKQKIYGTLNNNQYVVKEISIEVDVLPYTFIYNSTANTYTIYKYYGTETNIVVPSKFKNIFVDKLYTRSFEESNDLLSIELPDTLTYIYDFAFSGCDNLENVYYNGTIEDWCKITIVNFTSNPMYYATNFFTKNELNEWEELTKIVIPDTITKIYCNQFYGFDKVTSIEIPNSVTNIQQYAFSECSSLINIQLPNSIIDIQNGAFDYCSKLENVYYEGTIENWCNISFNSNASNLMYYATNFYMLDENNTYQAVTEIIIPNTITTIGDNQFRGFDNVTQIQIPNSVTSIGKYAFYDCNSLTDVYYDGTEEEWNNIEILSGNDNLINAEVHFKESIKIFEENGEKYLYFGSYPQTKVIDTSKIASLNSMYSYLPTASDHGNWTDYGYYISGEKSSYMFYIDLELNNEKYRGVYFTEYRPYGAINASSSTYSNQLKNGYSKNSVFWFKYEPIKWNVLSELKNKILIMSDLLIDSQQYDIENGSYTSNYKESTIRTWLNEMFYNTAFNTIEKELLVTTLVDNSLFSTGDYTEGDGNDPYVCEDTNDKLFLLSYQQASTFFITDEEREAQPTDYAKSQGCGVSEIFSGNSNWWLRSPAKYYNYCAQYISQGGGFSSTDVYYTDYGIRPACWINLL